MRTCVIAHIEVRIKNLSKSKNVWNRFHITFIFKYSSYKYLLSFSPQGGLSTLDEMCLTFVYYYPKFPVENCVSMNVLDHFNIPQDQVKKCFDCYVCTIQLIYSKIVLTLECVCCAGVVLIFQDFINECSQQIYETAGKKPRCISVHTLVECRLFVWMEIMLIGHVI